MDEKVRKKISKFDRSKDNMVMPVNDEMELGFSTEVEPNREKKKMHKHRKNRHIEENSTGLAAKEQTCSNEGDVACMRNGEEENNKSKRKKRKKGRDNCETTNGITADDKEMKFLDDKKEKKMMKRKNCDDSGMQEVSALKNSKKSKGTEAKDFKNGEANSHTVIIDDDDHGKKKKKKLSIKRKRTEDSEFESHEGDPLSVNINMGDASTHPIATEVDDHGRKKKKKRTKNKADKHATRRNPCNVVADANSPNLAGEGTSKRVRFSDQVEVVDDGLVRGKRFTLEEDEKIKEAVYKYIESHGLGDNGLEMVLFCHSYPQLRGCWKEIAMALPHRPVASVYSRGHILFERDDSHTWTPEEYELLKKYKQTHGSNWRMLADAMGKHRIHIKDAWRRVKLSTAKKGPWSQEEYQTLFDLVNADLSMRALEDHRIRKHGMLRDNICWEAIAQKMVTRNSQSCCGKWYDQLTSRMVAKGEWTDTDDYRLINALHTLDACCMEDVDWDNLLDERSGDACRKRWNQMVRHVGEHGNKSFPEQVEILSKRYCPDLLEARETFDNKPVIY